MAFPFGGTYRNDALKHLIREERPVVFDIGANEGQTIASLLSAFPQASIHAFEPIPDLARNLQERWKRSPNVRVNALAVGERAEVRPFHVNDFSQSSSFLSLSARGAYSANNVKTIDTIDVQVTSVDQYCTDQRIDRIHFCKIDVQGCSTNVLTGAKDCIERRLIEVFQIEYLFHNYYDRTDSFFEIESFLVPRGYRLYTLLHTDTDQIGRMDFDRPTGELRHLDALYVRADSRPK